ncbi:hypothetical protein D3C73_685470 [compost metagenome]
MYLIGVIIGQGFKIEFLSILGTICLVLGVCLVALREKKWRVTVNIFMTIFLIGQAIAYGFHVEFLKSYASINDGSGSSYSIVSVVFPLILAFVSKYIYRVLNKKSN